MFEQSDGTLVSKALNGNKRAWLKLVKRYEKPIYNYALRMVSNPADAMDLMQETFISVNRNLSTYRGDGAFKSWLFRIANFRCIEFYRRKKVTEDLDDVAEPQADSTSCPEFLLNMQQGGDEILSALKNLPVEQKLVVELKFYQELTFDDIAVQLNISSNTAKSRLYSALGRLKQYLEAANVR